MLATTTCFHAVHVVAVFRLAGSWTRTNLQALASEHFDFDSFPLFFVFFFSGSDCFHVAATSAKKKKKSKKISDEEVGVSECGSTPLMTTN